MLPERLRFHATDQPMARIRSIWAATQQIELRKNFVPPGIDHLKARILCTLPFTTPAAGRPRQRKESALLMK